MNSDDLFKRYSSGDKSALGEIFAQYKPMIGGMVGQYKETGLPDAALDMEAKRIIMKSLKTYNPEAGNLTSHIQNNMKSMFRETNKASQMYIPDARASLYGKYKSTYAGMSDELGRPPTDTEVADKLKIGIGDVRRLSRETGVLIKPDTFSEDSDDYKGDNYSDPKEFISFIRKQLKDPVDMKILDLSFSAKESPTNSSIGESLGISEGAVRQRKNRIIKLIRENE